MGEFEKWNPFVFATDILAAREAWNYQEQRNLLLAITMEEAGELIRACSKLMRHGDEEKHLINLREEMADVQACIQLLGERYDVSKDFLLDRMVAKTFKISKEITK
jgi:NTP pyrophosphatase (non-canonical NTP hydrolase)